MTNRIIKFKVWWPNEDQNGGRMIANPGVSFSNLNSIFEDMKDSWTFLQYTGLKYCLGKEIYEGDIVRCFDTAGEKVYDREVDFYGFRDEIWSEEIQGKTKVEIIGNIWENPDLLI